MHDKAHERFRLLDIHEKHKFYLKLADKYKLTSISDKYIKCFNFLFFFNKIYLLIEIKIQFLQKKMKIMFV